MSDPVPTMETDVLIIGTGPAGGAAACALSTYGVRNMIINKYGFTCRTPRAHNLTKKSSKRKRHMRADGEVHQADRSRVGRMLGIRVRRPRNQGARSCRELQIESRPGNAARRS